MLSAKENRARFFFFFFFFFLSSETCYVATRQSPRVFSFAIYRANVRRTGYVRFRENCREREGVLKSVRWKFLDLVFDKESSSVKQSGEIEFMVL